MSKRPPFQIKICGITRPNDAVAAVQAGADAIGLNFCPASPRFISMDRARKIVEAVQIAIQSKGWRRPVIVGVFVAASAAEIAEAVTECSLDAVQFHGQESISILNQFSRSLKNGKRLITVRVLRIPAYDSANMPPRKFDSGAGPVLDQMIQEANAWKDAGVDAILFDAAVPGELGGSGKTIDWSLVRQFEVGLPIILAGGLNPQNIARAIKESGVQAVDVASGVESSLGIKDELLLRQFVDCSGMRTDLDNLAQL